VKKGKYYEMLEKGKMQELGNVQRALSPWAVFNPWTTQDEGPKFDHSNESSRFYVYDDAAAATINPWAVFNPWSSQETQSTLEIDTLKHNQIQAEPYKAMLCQGNLGPRRVLNMLRDNIAQLNNNR
jgi:hypothetical protein